MSRALFGSEGWRLVAGICAPALVGRAAQTRRTGIAYQRLADAGMGLLHLDRGGLSRHLHHQLPVARVRPADAGDDLVDDLEEMVVITKADVRLEDATLFFDKYVLAG